MSKKFGLTQEQQASFRANGFVGPFDLYEADEIKDTYKRIRAGLFDRSHAAYELDNKSVIAGYDRHLDVNDLSKHIMRREIVDKLTDILGPDLICWRSELFPKYPGDEGTDWHQADTFAHASGEPQIVWPQNDRFGGAITVWTALTDASGSTGSSQSQHRQPSRTPTSCRVLMDETVRGPRGAVPVGGRPTCRGGAGRAGGPR